MKKKSIILIFIGLSIIGLSFISLMPGGLKQENTSDNMSVSFSTTGSNSQNIELNITSKIERTLSSIEDIVKITSTTTNTGGDITISFSKNSDIQKKRIIASSLLRQLYPKLPANTSYPLISIAEQNNEQENQELIVYDLSALKETLSQEYLDAKLIVPLKNIKGINDVNLEGLDQYEIIIECNQSKMDVLDISEQEIINAIENRNTKIHKLFFDKEGKKNIVIECSPDTNNPDLSKIVLIGGNGRRISIEDIAKVYIEKKQVNHIYRINGKNTLRLVVFTKNKKNIIPLSKEVKKTIETIKKSTSDNIIFSLAYDSSKFIKKELEVYIKYLIYSLIIVFAFLSILTRKIKPVLILISGIIIGLLISIPILYYLGIGINKYSVFAYSMSAGISTGILFVSWKNNSKILKRKIVLFLFSFSLIILSAWFFKNNSQDWSDFAPVLAVNLLCSSIVAIFFLPATNIYIENSKNNKLLQKFRFLLISYQKVIENKIIFRTGIILFSVLLFGIPVHLLPEKIENSDNSVSDSYNKIVDTKIFKRYIKPNLITFLGGSFRIFQANVSFKSDFEQSTGTVLYVNTQMPPETSIEQMNKTIKNLEEYLSGFKEIELYKSNIYQSYGSVEIYFKSKYKKTSFPYLLKGRLTDFARNSAGAEWDIYGVGIAFSNSQNGESLSFRFEFKGYNFLNTQLYVENLTNLLSKNKRVQKIRIKNGNADRLGSKKINSYNLIINNQKIAEKNINKNIIVEEIKKYDLEGIVQSSIFYNNKNYDIRIKRPEIESTIQNIQYKTMNFANQKIKLDDIASFEKSISDEIIYKEDMSYCQIIDFEYIGSYEYGNKFTKQIIKDFNNSIPVGYHAREVNFFDFYQENENKSSSLLYFILALCFFVIISSYYESLYIAIIHSLIILFSLSGIFLAFVITNTSLNSITQFSFILSFAIVPGISILSGSLRKINNFDYIPFIFFLILSLTPNLFNERQSTEFFALSVAVIGGSLFAIIGFLLLAPAGNKYINSDTN